jgi:putative flippase GtrA
MDNHKTIIIQFIKFGLVGVVNTFTSYVITNLLYYVFHFHLQVCNIIAFIISVFVSYTLNSIFVFDNKNQNLINRLKSLGKSYISYAFTGLLLTGILLEVEVNSFSIPLYIAS